LIFGFYFDVPTVHAQQPHRIQLIPKYVPGQSFRYSLESESTTKVSTAGSIQNPQAAGEVTVAVSALLRVNVLDAVPDSQRPARSARVHLRTTYERISATTKADIPDPELAETEAQYRALEGKSIEFWLQPDAAVSDVKGLEEFTPEIRAAFTDWLSRLSLGISQPAGGIVPGQKWATPAPRNQPAPLAGIEWQTESTYLRNDSCRAATLTADAKVDTISTPDSCAVIHTRFTITQKPLKDQTPEDYKKRGLRSAGTMSGSAESTTYISLASGFVISVSQDGFEESDITLVNEEHNLRMRYVGKVKTHSQIRLITDRK
jgi:hypothetical protein